MNISLRSPVPEDGAELHNLVVQCSPLDENSRYCNLLQVSHFKDDAIVAEADGEMVGFVTGYRIPDRQDVLFVWQVGVSPRARGQGLGNAMLEALLERRDEVRYVETTITPDNMASRKMFERFASTYGARIETDVLFQSQRHFEGQHDDEVLYRIGPFPEQRSVSQ